MTLEKMVQIGLLFDFYGRLLTEKQREMVDLYYRQDLSLGEIASQTGVSRQAVHDLIKRASEILADYEAKLGLADRYRRQQERLTRAIGHLDDAMETFSLSSLRQAREILAGLLDE